ncbi:MAG: hypothetical protein ACRDGU_00520 [Actinomycetota bacterium]
MQAVDAQADPATKPLLTRAGEHLDEGLSLGCARELQAFAHGAEDRISAAGEGERRLLVRDLGRGIAPTEPEEPVCGGPLEPSVGGVLDAEQRSMVVPSTLAPPTDLLEGERVVCPLASVRWPLEPPT